MNGNEHGPCAGIGSMNDFLPQTRRTSGTQYDAKAAGSRALTREERLNRMRIEDRRRALNEEDRNRASSSSMRSVLNARAPAFEPYLQSASARAGALYYASSSLLEEDRSKMQRDRALRQKFAGPAPPTSWRAETADGDDKENTESLAENARRSREHRGRALEAISRFFPHRAGNQMPSSVPSLVDTCLCKLAHHLSPDERPAEVDFLCTFAHTIPLHLKERLMALSGRLSMAPALSEGAIDLLFRNTEEVRRKGNDTADSREEEDDEYRDELPESWDTESASDADAFSCHDPRICDFVDLSYAQLSTRSVRGLLLNSGIRADGIRSLSLAGWGSHHCAEGPNKTCLRASSGLLGVIDKLLGLKYLSLADTELLSSAHGGHPVLNTVPQQVVSEAIAFLKKLSRRTARLHTLDLSFCTWINGAVIANVGWHSTSLPVRRLVWPNLQNLILTGCPALLARRCEEGAHGHFQESGPFVGAWHAAHHGVARVTQSPFFLSHRPGLGRAVLADGVGAWDSASGRGSLVERQAAALSNHRRSAAVQARQTTPSPFDDGAASMDDAFAISHGIAPFASTRQQTTAGGSNEELKPRCPVSTARVEPHEWERARILDAVRGRWGSAILGITDDDDGGGREGVYTIVYF